LFCDATPFSYFVPSVQNSFYNDQLCKEDRRNNKKPPNTIVWRFFY
jgi:hypothetical protein